MTRKMNRKILFVSSEVAPFSKTGGLADVSAALPDALAALGCDIRILTPRHGSIDIEHQELVPLEVRKGSVLSIQNHDFHVKYLTRKSQAGEPVLYFLDCAPLFDRPGIYVDPFSNRDYLDNDYRYIALSKAAFELCRALDWQPDIFHCHDWQSSLVAFYLMLDRESGNHVNARSVMTIHNMAYQGLFPAETVGRIGGAERFFRPGGPLEFHERVNFLKAGIEFPDGINTVSPTYAKEIQSSFDFSFGLESLLRSRGDLVGILNGIDVDVWNPSTDSHIPANYTVENLELKERNKQALCKQLKLPYNESLPLFGMISRIVGQKGLDLIVSALPEILNIPAQFVLLGSGDPYYEHILREFARVFPERAAVRIGYDEDLSHLIEAGVDIFLMPSQYEPCGLNQMMSMRYGTVPVVRATGGLADTVIDSDQDQTAGTGFSFTAYTAPDLASAAQRAVHAYRDRARWRMIQRNGMSRDFSWRRSAELYLNLYEHCLAKPARVVA